MLDALACPPSPHAGIPWTHLAGARSQCMVEVRPVAALFCLENASFAHLCWLLLKHPVPIATARPSSSSELRRALATPSTIFHWYWHSCTLYLPIVVLLQPRPLACSLLFGSVYTSVLYPENFHQHSTQTNNIQLKYIIACSPTPDGIPYTARYPAPLSRSAAISKDAILASL